MSSDLRIWCDNTPQERLGAGLFAVVWASIAGYALRPDLAATLASSFALSALCVLPSLAFAFPVLVQRLFLANESALIGETRVLGIVIRRTRIVRERIRAIALLQVRIDRRQPLRMEQYLVVHLVDGRQLSLFKGASNDPSLANDIESRAREVQNAAVSLLRVPSETA